MHSSPRFQTSKIHLSIIQAASVEFLSGLKRREIVKSWEPIISVAINRTVSEHSHVLTLSWSEVRDVKVD